MEARPGCRNCTDPLPEHELEAGMERLWSRMKLKDGEAVPDQEYERRLALCHSCDALTGGTTCRYCGCLVKWRSRLTASSCPHPGSPRW
ncbi:DUF6171 family protein [Gorillibacterium sp. sgz5001074]|uniref:DUF6171 family protein n=1 Tax=Gorillibacterium sp. sgz5001074 TaxID=3446695 RepID=UPI003F67FBF1